MERYSANQGYDSIHGAVLSEERTDRVPEHVPLTSSHKRSLGEAVSLGTHSGDKHPHEVQDNQVSSALWRANDLAAG